MLSGQLFGAFVFIKSHLVTCFHIQFMPAATLNTNLSITVILTPLSDYEGNLLYLNECKE